MSATLNSLFQKIDKLHEIVQGYELIVVTLLLVAITLIVCCWILVLNLKRNNSKHQLFQRELRNDVKMFYTPRKKSP